MKTKQPNILKCKRISIIGPSGSGKSTLAIKLGEILNLPVYHIDMLFWKPNWERTEQPILNKRVRKISKTKKWIIDGTYKDTLKFRFRRSDIVIFLDFSEDFCINSVKERFKKGHENRVGLAAELQETEEGINELIGYIKIFFQNKKQVILELKKKYAKNKCIDFKTREEVNLFIEKLNISD